MEGVSGDASTTATTTTSNTQDMAGMAFKTPAKSKEGASFHTVTNYAHAASGSTGVAPTREPLSTPDTADRAASKKQDKEDDVVSAPLPKPIQEFKKVQLKLNKVDKIERKQARGEKLDNLQVQMLAKKEKFEAQLQDLEDKMDAFLNSGAPEATKELREAYGVEARKARGSVKTTSNSEVVPKSIEAVVIEGEAAAAAGENADNVLKLNRHVTTTSAVSADDDSDDEVIDTIDDNGDDMTYNNMTQYNEYDAGAYG